METEIKNLDIGGERTMDVQIDTRGIDVWIYPESGINVRVCIVVTPDSIFLAHDTTGKTFRADDVLRGEKLPNQVVLNQTSSDMKG